MYLKLIFPLVVLAYCVKADGHENRLTDEYDKEGECPEPSAIESATDSECYTDADCRGKKKCCRDESEKYQCIKPRRGERPGKCPVEEIGICVIFEPICTSDEDCKRDEKCCRNACGGKSCKPRELEKDEKILLLCPALKPCSSDADCRGNKMCCPNDCGFKTCKKGEKNDKGKKDCPAQRVTLPIHDQCKTDDECPGRKQKCCPNECCVKTCVKAKEIDCSKVRCADPNCGFSEVAYTPKNSCCQTCKTDCSRVFCLNPVCKPDEVRFVPEGGCCYQCKQDCSRILCALPVCEEGEETRVLEGDCCPTCIEDCKGKQCHPVNCKPGEIKYRPKGKCCEICKPDEPLCKDGKKPQKDTICAGIAGFRCDKGFICDLSNVPPGTADGAGICCKATCVDEDTGEGYYAGETFKKNCNQCWCLKNGGIACTKILCRPCIQANGESYPSGSSYMVQCNRCKCSDGVELCTRIGCLGCESGLPAGGSCILTDPNACPTEGFDCEPNGKSGLCCKQPTCDKALKTTYCNNDDLVCPSKYHCQLDGGKEGLGFCCLDEPLCKDGKKPQKDTICAGIAGFKCDKGFICDLSNVPPGTVDGAGICCKATCVDEETGEGYYAGETFQKDCNTCWCLKNGGIACTKKLCRPCIQANGVSYPSGSSYMVQCNRCRCSDGVELCTRIGCLGCKSGLPAGESCIPTDPNSCPTKGFDCEPNGKSGLCCKQPTCDKALKTTYCNNDNLVCPSNYYCQLDGGKEGLGFCCLDCRTVKCAEPICKPGYVVYEPETECCKTCKKDCSATTCLVPICKFGEELFSPEGECCSLCKKPNDCYDKKRGVIYKEGEKFRFRCNSCQCENGDIACTELDCGEGYCESGLKPHPTDVCSVNKKCSMKGYKCEKSSMCCREPNCPNALAHTFCALDLKCPLGYKCNFLEEEGNGFCCKAKPCLKNGVSYESGESFKDQCNDCFCSDGVIACTKKACRPCIQANGVSYPSGSSYKVQCNTCGCSDGVEICTLIACQGCESGLPAGESCIPTNPNSCPTKGFDCEPNGKSGLCCKQPTCDKALKTTYCNNEGLICPSKYYCQLDGGKEGLGFCCLDCRTVKCAEPLCKPGYVVHQSETECCKTCKKDCSTVDCPEVLCKPGYVLHQPETECCETCKKDCSTVDCPEVLCKPGYVLHQPETECCETCKKDCSASTCLRPTCKFGEELFTPEGECCSLCKKPNDCYDKERGVIYKEGEKFRFRCNGCECKKGGITCTDLDCEEGYCKSGLKPHPTDVCSVYKKCSMKGYKCEKSSMCCREPNCPNALAHTFCALDLKCPLGYKCNFLGEEGNGFCCKAKPCFKNGVRYESGESFKDQCNDCFCTDGEITCTEKACPGCHFEGVAYDEGAAVKIDEKCGECVCVKTGEKDAPRFEVKCPNCCVKDDQVFKTGEGFQGLSVCEDCSCEEGEQYAEDKCALRLCPACVGIPKEGECCPDCSVGIIP